MIRTILNPSNIPTGFLRGENWTQVSVFASMARLTLRPFWTLQRSLGGFWTAVGWLQGLASRFGVLCVLLFALTSPAFADDIHPSVPAFSSSPGAAYTIYLDFGGFSFPDDWGFDSGTPGVTPAYHVDGNSITFSPTELANIQNVWSRVAEKYAPFNVNVTTVDPAPAVTNGQPTNDAQRTDYYDNQPAMMHTVIGGDAGWINGVGGGISKIGTTADAQPATNGYHTNFVFSAVNSTSATDLQFIGEAAAHENGHGLGLSHQSDYSTGPLPDVEYSLGTTPGTGPGSKAPTMGNSYSAERGTWKDGTAHVNDLGPTPQNDPQVILANAGMGSFINDGIGHSLGSATLLPTNAVGHIDSSVAKGVIVPGSSTNPVTSGESNYVADFWTFSTAASLVSLTVNAGRSSITPGVADPGATLDSTLRSLELGGGVIASSATINLSETLSLSLGMGTYYAEVVSAGAPDGLGFFDMGSYFLSGDIILVAVPEPSTFALLAVGLALVAFGIRRRRRG